MDFRGHTPAPPIGEQAVADEESGEWHSSEGYLIGLDPEDPTHYFVRKDEATILRDLVPVKVADPRAAIRLDVIQSCCNYGDGDFPGGLDGDDFLVWALSAQETAIAEYERRVAAHDEQIADDGWILASAVAPRTVEFLPGWEPYISIGHQTLLAGDPGVGKSTLALAIAAGVTKLARNIVILSAEDDHEAKLVPMLAKLGADLDRCVVQPIEKARTLNEEGLAKLDRALGKFDPLLVVIDPVTYFLGGEKDMHRANEVRSVMTELSARAAKHRCAIVPLMHLNKGGGKALYRILGSIDFPAVARSALLIGKCDEEPERGRVALHVKNNVGKLAEPKGFDLTEEPGDPFKLPRFEWRETDLTEADITGGSQASGGRTPIKRKTAEGIIISILKHGPQDAAIVKAAVEGAGISDSTLLRARKKLVDIEEHQPLGPAGGSRSIWKLKPLAESNGRVELDDETEAWLSILAGGE